MEKIVKDCVVEGAFSFATCVTGRGNSRFCVRVNGKAVVAGDDGVEREERVTVQAFGDWENALPQNLACLKGAIPADPVTGLRRTRKGEFVGSVKVPAGVAVTATPGMMPDVTFRNVELDSTDAFAVKVGSVKYVSCD